MNERRVLDATHLMDIFLWVLGSKGKVRLYRFDKSEIIIALSSDDFPNVDIEISSLAIDALAVKLRLHTLIDVSASVEDFTRVVAQIAIIVYHAGPKVSGSEVNPGAFERLVHKISIEYAVACAASFVKSCNYDIDLNKVSAQEISIALLMRDADAVAEIFSKSLYLMPNKDGLGRRTRLIPRDDAEYDAMAFIRFLESELADGNPIPDPAPKDANRQISATNYTKLCFIAELEGWGAEQTLILIDGYLSPYAAQRDAEALIRFLEKRHSDVSPIPSRATKGVDRHLSAASHWNLRSVAPLEGWSDYQTLQLIEEHLFPTLDPDLVHHSNTVSGSDWVRLYNSRFGPNGNVLWNFRVGSSRT
jgi:hypothetical protein